MRWKRVASERAQPAKGRYSDWKPQIANDCHQQCVYCAIHESRYGGLDNFHIDHLKPKSKFEELEQIIANLFLSCAICNRFKSNDWPAEPLEDHSLPAYPDPSSYDYNGLFQIHPDTYVVSGNHPASVYVAEKLYLNRPQLIIERRSFFLEERLAALEDFANTIGSRVLEGASAEVLRSVNQFLIQVIEIGRLFRQANKLRPYELADVRRN